MINYKFFSQTKHFILIDLLKLTKLQGVQIFRYIQKTFFCIFASIYTMRVGLDIFCILGKIVCESCKISKNYSLHVLIKPLMKKRNWETHFVIITAIARQEILQCRVITKQSITDPTNAEEMLPLLHNYVKIFVVLFYCSILLYFAAKNEYILRNCLKTTCNILHHMTHLFMFSW